MSLIECEDFNFVLVAVTAGVGSLGTSSFYVIPHPIFWLTVPYGLLLCFASALFPSSIPDYLPLGPLARYDHYPFYLSLNSEKILFSLNSEKYCFKIYMEDKSIITAYQVENFVAVAGETVSLLDCALPD